MFVFLEYHLLCDSQEAQFGLVNVWFSYTLGRLNCAFKSPHFSISHTESGNQAPSEAHRNTLQTQEAFPFHSNLLGKQRAGEILPEETMSDP